MEGFQKKKTAREKQGLISAVNHIKKQRRHQRDRLLETQRFLFKPLLKSAAHLTQLGLNSSVKFSIVTTFLGDRYQDNRIVSLKLKPLILMFLLLWNTTVGVCLKHFPHLPSVTRSQHLWKESVRIKLPLYSGGNCLLSHWVMLYPSSSTVCHPDISGNTCLRLMKYGVISTRLKFGLPKLQDKSLTGPFIQSPSQTKESFLSNGVSCANETPSEMWK